MTCSIINEPRASGSPVGEARNEVHASWSGILQRPPCDTHSPQNSIQLTSMFELSSNPSRELFTTYSIYKMQGVWRSTKQPEISDLRSSSIHVSSSSPQQPDPAHVLDRDTRRVVNEPGQRQEQSNKHSTILASSRPSCKQRQRPSIESPRPDANVESNNPSHLERQQHETNTS